MGMRIAHLIRSTDDNAFLSETFMTETADEARRRLVLAALILPALCAAPVVPALSARAAEPEAPDEEEDDEEPREDQDDEEESEEGSLHDDDADEDSDVNARGREGRRSR